MEHEPRKIIHIDMDAFYASVEVRDDPSLRDRPIAVGGDPNSRGVIATSNYIARKFGVRSAMPSWKAKKLCPDLLIIYPHFDKYKAESRAIQDIFGRFTDVIEPLSLDEAFLDVTGKDILGGSATLMAQEIRRLIWEERQLTASAGVAPNKFLAKVASDWNKPNGLFVIAPEDVSVFVKTLPIEDIFGVGKVTAEKFHSLNIYTCGDLQKLDLVELERHFGSRARSLYLLSRGIDERPVETDWIRKSISVEDTFPRDLETLEACLEQVPQLYRRLLERYQKIRKRYFITKLFAKVKFNDFKATTIESSAYTTPDIEYFKALVEAGWHRKNRPVRLLGIGFRLSIEEDLQMTLW